MYADATIFVKYVNIRIKLIPYIYIRLYTIISRKSKIV